MKKNNQPNFFQNKIFYGTLLTCASLMAVLVITFSLGKSGDNGSDDFAELEDLSSNVAFDTNTAARSEITPPAVSRQDTGEVQAFSSETKETDLKVGIAEETIEEVNAKNTPVKPAEPKEEEKATVTVPPAKPVETNDQKKEDTKADAEEVVILDSFDDSTEIALSWPLDGDIVMDFSSDTAIYDVTLDQYRTNDSLRITGPVGTQVIAAGSGVVETVFYDEEKGNVVVVDHGNGLKTTYGQLQDGILVKQGQSVKRGQVIGGVANPTKYGILNGGHLDFGVLLNGEPKDPKMMIAGEE